MSKTHDDSLAAWQAKIGPGKNLRQEYNARLERLLKLNPDIEKAEKDAIGQTYALVMGELRSPAVSFTGVVVSKSEPTDYNKFKWAKAERLFKEDPAIAQAGEFDASGNYTFKTDDKGQPLDCRQYWDDAKTNANRNYMKVIAKTAWERKIIGVSSLTNPVSGSPNKADVPTKFLLTLRDELADPESPLYFDPPEGVAIEFRAINKTKKDDIDLKLTGSTVATKLSASPAKLPPMDTILQKYFINDIIPAEQIVQTYERKGRSYVIVEGFVLAMNREPNEKTGNKMIQITSAEMDMNETQKSITGWVPKYIPMDFPVESKVRLFGMTDRRKVYENGEDTGELSEVNINVHTIQVLLKGPEQTDKGTAFDPTKFKVKEGVSGMPDALMT